VPALTPTGVRRVGHKGADLIVPGNTAASFDAALSVGVDMIEFDVLISRDGERTLLLAHDYEDAEGRPALTLAQGLAHLAQDRFAGIELDVDVKLPGYEREVLAALREAGLTERALVSTQYPASLAVFRTLEPSLRLGWSVPKLRRDPFRSRALALPALAGLQAARAGFPGRAATALRAGWCDAIMAHWRLVTPRLVRQVQAAGGELYVWTVDEPERIRALAVLGVTGVITNDPRLFDGDLCAPRATAS
jgi:glycerophosphoryl diester phosphodiesterase